LLRVYIAKIYRNEAAAAEGTGGTPAILNAKRLMKAAAAADRRLVLRMRSSGLMMMPGKNRLLPYWIS